MIRLKNNMEIKGHIPGELVQQRAPPSGGCFSAWSSHTHSTPPSPDPPLHQGQSASQTLRFIVSKALYSSKFQYLVQDGILRPTRIKKCPFLGPLFRTVKSFLILESTFLSARILFQIQVNHSLHHLPQSWCRIILTFSRWNNFFPKVAQNNVWSFIE